MPSYAEVDHDDGRKLATTAAEDDGPVWMVNLMHYKERAVYADGRETSLTGRQADDGYTPLGPLAAVGAEIVIAVDVDTQFLGDRSRGIASPWFATPPAPPSSPCRSGRTSNRPTSTRRRAWPRPSSSAASPSPCPSSINRSTGPTCPTTHRGRRRLAVPNGVRIDGWFSAEGTILGDVRAWHQVRFNTFPSRRAFLAVDTDPDRFRAHADHRDTAIADTYAIGVRAMISSLSESVPR